jgi:hypothetical protein
VHANNAEELSILFAAHFASSEYSIHIYFVMTYLELQVTVESIFLMSLDVTWLLWLKYIKIQLHDMNLYFNVFFLNLEQLF